MLRTIVQQWPWLKFMNRFLPVNNSKIGKGGKIQWKSVKGCKTQWKSMGKCPNLQPADRRETAYYSHSREIKTAWRKWGKTWKCLPINIAAPNKLPIHKQGPMKGKWIMRISGFTRIYKLWVFIAVQMAITKTKN